MYVTLFVLSVIFVIMFHEFGHFATAKAFGMKCEKFFLGFGPTLWSIRRGETEYGVKAIPAGGFVKITGMSKYEEIDPADVGRTFHEKPAWQRTIVLSAGSATHILVAFVLLVGALGFIGLPEMRATNVVATVGEGTPAEEAGLAEGDRIVAVDGRATTDFETVRELVAARGGETVGITVERAGAEEELSVTLTSRVVEGETVGFLGVGPEGEQIPAQPMGLGPALSEALTGELSLWNLTRETVVGLLQALSPAGLADWLSTVPGDQPRSAEGPISLVGVGQAVGALGETGNIAVILLLLASLNLVLGIMNMLPLPPLDGGHLAVLLVEEGVNKVRAVRGRSTDWQMDPAKLTPIALAVIMFFVVISLTALYVDIVKPAGDLFR
jgi:membrane-associated protease RseP (regulator of RpoE activity)